MSANESNRKNNFKLDSLRKKRRKIITKSYAGLTLRPFSLYSIPPEEEGVAGSGSNDPSAAMRQQNVHRLLLIAWLLGTSDGH